MKRLPLFFILASVFTGPALAEVYGEAAPTTPEATSRIKTVPRALPPAAAPSPSGTATATPEKSGGDIRAWRLSAGRLVRQELISWGEQAGWHVLWQLPRDWTVPAETNFEGDFKEAASAVIRTLSDNGLVIRGQFYDGNRTLVVSGAGPIVPDPQ